MLVADVIVHRHFQHVRQVCHLEYPETVVSEGGCNVSDERARVFQVIEHGNARNDSSLLGSTALGDGAGVEEVDYSLKGLAIDCYVASWIEAQSVDTRNRIRPE